MIDEIDLSMVESMALFTYRVNGRLPGFHPEIFEVVRKNEQFLLQRRYSNETTAIPADQIVRVLKALPKDFETILVACSLSTRDTRQK